MNNQLIATLLFIVSFPLPTFAQGQFSSKAPPLFSAGYRITPVLTEPHIHEPAAIAGVGNGRLYVVEMPTSMQEIDGKNKLAATNRVSRHEDTNGDGLYDKHTIFADKLSISDCSQGRFARK